MIDFEKFKSYLDSEEGQQAMDRMSEKWAKEDDFNKRWKNRFKNFLKEQTDENLEKLFHKFEKHAEKRRDILWKQRYDGETSLYNPLFSAMKKLGKNLKRKDIICSQQGCIFGKVIKLNLIVDKVAFIH